MSLEYQNKPNGPPTCGKCGKHIFDGTILQAQGKFWHNSCLQCAICRKLLDRTCHFKDNKFYCREDFVRNFGATCSACKKIIAPAESVHVVSEHVYHTSCFTCSVCRRHLQTGSDVYLKEDAGLICNHDYQQLLNNGCNDLESDSETDESGSDEPGDLQPDTSSIHDNQLRMLMDAYNANSRPDKATRQELCQLSGLQSRTIQIWFHNRRSKDKTAQRKQRMVNRLNIVPDRRRNLSQEIGYTGDQRHISSNQWVNLIPGRSSDLEYNGGHIISRHVENGKRTKRETTMYSQNHQNHIELPVPEHDDNNGYTEMEADAYQLYCPLDYLLPNDMPPNVELSSADLCNGEVLRHKQNTGSNKYHVVPQTSMRSVNDNRTWLVA